MILLFAVAVLLIVAIGIQVWYWRNAVSLGVELPRILKVLMSVNIAALTVALGAVGWFGYVAMTSGEM